MRRTEKRFLHKEKYQKVDPSKNRSDRFFHWPIHFLILLASVWKNRSLLVKSQREQKIDSRIRKNIFFGPIEEPIQSVLPLTDSFFNIAG